MEKGHYEKFSDKALLVEGKYSHLTTVSEWSLKSVNAIIDACTRALFGDKKILRREASSQKQMNRQVNPLRQSRDARRT